MKHSECDEVSDEARNLIYREFQELCNNQAKWQFIASHIRVYTKNKSTSKGPSRREYTHQYFLTVGGHKVKVCRRLFLSTLNVSEAVIRTSLEKLSPQGICDDDNRGRKPPPNKLSSNDEKFLRNHILSFPQVDSGQGKLKNSKTYLDSSLSISSMHKMYINVCKDAERKPVSIETYRRICKEYNICFTRSQRNSSKSLSNQSSQKENFINKETPISSFKPSQPSIMGYNQVSNIKTNSSNNFTIMPYLLNVDTANIERTNCSYYSSLESNHLSPIVPEISFCSNINTEKDCQNATGETL